MKVEWVAKVDARGSAVKRGGAEVALTVEVKASGEKKENG
jgi:hypothetical protein